MKTFLALLVGIAIGAAAIWIYQGNRINPGRPVREEQAEEPAKAAGGETREDKLRALNLHTDGIKEELNRTGRVMRQKAQAAGQAISDATADARATAAIKGKLVADPDLSALSISVNTTDGVVTLSGTVNSEEDIGKAMLLALESENVQQVVSTLQVKPK